MSAAIGIAVLLIGVLSVAPPLFSRHVEERQIAAAPPPPPAPPPAPRIEVIRPGSEPRGTGVRYPDVPAVAAVEPADASATAPMKLPESAAVASGRPVPKSVPDAAPGETAETQVALAKSAAVSLPGGPAGVASREVESPSKPELVLPKAAVVPPSSAGSAPKQDGEIPKPEAVAPQLHAAVRQAGDETGRIDSTGGNGTSRLDGVQFTPVVVRDGDSISAIALREYGQASYTILDLLELANPELRDLDTISAGQTIRLPSLADGFPILTDGSSQYALLVFSTPQQRRAAVLQSVLRGHGLPANMVPGSAGAGRPLYRVVVPGSGDRDALIGIGKQVQQVFREDRQLARLGE